MSCSLPVWETREAGMGCICGEAAKDLDLDLDLGLQGLRPYPPQSLPGHVNMLILWYTLKGMTVSCEKHSSKIQEVIFSREINCFWRVL